MATLVGTLSETNEYSGTLADIAESVATIGNERELAASLSEGAP